MNTFLKDWADDIHKNAVEHGWWDGERTLEQTVSLCCSELSEALEELRDNKPNEYFIKDGRIETDMSLWHGEKTEGVAVEVADCLIRVLDYAGEKEYSFGESMNVKPHIYDATVTSMFKVDRSESDFCNFYVALTKLLVGLCKPIRDSEEKMLYMIIKYTSKWFSVHKLELWDIVERKHEYNKTRPYKHGGKAL